MTKIDPGKVPQRRLFTGALMPAVGMGTFGSDHVSAQEVSQAVAGAVEAGYRSFDCAACYGNEAQIGQVFADAFARGTVKREELFIASKVWNDMHGDGDVLIACARTLKDLKLDYLDMYYVHWPFPNYHAPGCDVDSRNPDARPFSVEEFMKTWRQMERHPCFQQPELFAYCKEQGIEPVGFCPIGSPSRPERDKTPEDITDIELPEIRAIA